MSYLEPLLLLLRLHHVEAEHLVVPEHGVPVAAGLSTGPVLESDPQECGLAAEANEVEGRGTTKKTHKGLSIQTESDNILKDDSRFYCPSH